ncbi:hypothetical protein Tco_0077953 [Tanacetum coccineum]
MGDRTSFLGLQVTHKDDGIFISEDKYVDEILNKFSFLVVKTASTPMETSKPLLKDAKAGDVDVHLYRSMIGSLKFRQKSKQEPSTSQPQKKQPRRKQRKDTKVLQPSGSTEPITDEAANKEHVPTHSNDPLLSGEDRLKLNELMELCTNLSQRVLDLENTKTSQDVEITKLKKMVKKLEKTNKSRILGLKILRKVGRSAQVVSSKDEVSESRECEVEKKAQTEGSKKRTREELESDSSKKQKIDKNVEVEVDDEAEMKKYMEIVYDDEVEIDAIPLATKSPIIVDWKINKEGKIGYFQIIKADGSSRRYSSMIRMLQNIDKEDLETL